MFRHLKTFKWNRAAAIGSVILAHLFASSALNALQLRVAAAADLQFAMNDLVAKYEARTKQVVEVVYGSSGNFLTQIQNGAPFDLFFSADSSYPARLIDQGLAEKSSLYRYAMGRLAIWAPLDEHLSVSEKGFRALLDTRVSKIALANPEHAPYGRAAVAALQKAGVYEQIKSKLVYGENISQAAQFVQSGSAQAGLVALSLASSPSMQNGDRWVVPAAYHSSLEQAAVIITSSKNKKAASDFLDFVKSSEGREVLLRYGFTVVSDPAGKNQ
jgi:molybdate transport system substrate-binding protein